MIFFVFGIVRSKIVVCENFLYLSSILNKVSSQQHEQMYCMRSVSEIQFILVELEDHRFSCTSSKIQLILTFLSSFSFFFSTNVPYM